MKRAGVTLIKPGAVLIIILAASVGFVVFNWASGMLDATENQSAQNRQSSIRCSTLGMDLQTRKLNSTHYSASIYPDQFVEAVAVTFENGRNVTKIATNVQAGSVREITAQISEVSDIRAHVKGCSRVFRE